MLDLAKARRARLGRQARSDAYTPGTDPGRLGRYTFEQVQKAGAEGKAFRMPDGSYAYAILTEADIANAVAAYRANPIPGLRRFITERAALLGGNAVERLPKGWAEPKTKLHPNELGPTGAIGVPNVEASAGGGAGASEGGGMGGGAI